MKKLAITLPILAVIYLFMTFFMADRVENEVKAALSENQQADFSTELLDYQRNFFSAKASSRVKITLDQETLLTLNIASTISHYPFQAVIKNEITLADETLAKRVEHYFGSTNWLISEEKINLFSQLTGKLTILAGEHKSDGQFFSSSPLSVSYQFDLKNKNGEINLLWPRLAASMNGSNIVLNSLQIESHLGEPVKQSDYDYNLRVDNVDVTLNNNNSLFEGIQLIGRSRQGEVAKTIDTSNTLLLRSYQFNDGIQQTFTDNRIKLELSGLHQPAFELLHQGSDDAQELGNALIELVYHGAQLTLSQLNSNTPWGEVDGRFDITLDKGASLSEIMANPYILFDFINGDMSLVLPATLLDEPIVAESLQMGLMSGFLKHTGQTLNLETSFQRGELIVNGRVIPL